LQTGNWTKNDEKQVNNARRTAVGEGHRNLEGAVLHIGEIASGIWISCVVATHRKKH